MSEDAVREFIQSESFPSALMYLGTYFSTWSLTDVLQAEAISGGVGSENVDFGIGHDAAKSECYASFGDHGITATVGAFGQLLQMSSYLGAGSSGMFSVDHNDVEEPYLVEQRARQLQFRLQQPFHFGPAQQPEYSYGLRFPGLVLRSLAEPQLRWMNWRWPCHEYSRGDFEDHPNLRLTIQWMVHEKTVLQRCLVENNGDDFQLDVELSTSMFIRDLDHLDPYCEFNYRRYEARADGLETPQDQHMMAGPKGFSWVCVHKLPDTTDESKSENSHSVSFSEEDPLGDAKDSKWRPEDMHNPGHHEPESKRPYGVSVACSVAINGRVQLFDNSTFSQKWSLVYKGGQVGEPDGQHYSAEVITAYKMSLLDGPKTDWENHIIPWHIMKAVQSVNGQKPAEPSPSRASKQSGHFMPYIGQPSENYLLGGNYFGSNINATGGKDGDNAAGIPTRYTTISSSVPTPAKSSSRKIQGLPHDLEFLVRRNLEHILSVCAVQVATPKASEASTTRSTTSSLPKALQDVEAVALTLGDMSGHRICWSASL